VTAVLYLDLRAVASPLGAVFDTFRPGPAAKGPHYRVNVLEDVNTSRTTCSGQESRNTLTTGPPL